MNDWKFKLKDVNGFKSLCGQIGCNIDAIEDVSILAEPVKAGGLLIPNSLAVHPMEGADSDLLAGRLNLRCADTEDLLPAGRVCFGQKRLPLCRRAERIQDSFG